MPDLANVLKEEIRRLAKKELKEPVGALKKVTVQQRREIAALKRENVELKRRLALLESGARRRQKQPSEDEGDGIIVRFSPSWVSGHRQKLGLTQAQYAALVGVSPMTIYNWEGGHTRPGEAQLAAWGEVKKLGKREALHRLEQG